MGRRIASLGLAAAVALLGWIGSSTERSGPLGAVLLPMRLTRGVLLEGRGDQRGAAGIYRELARGSLHRAHFSVLAARTFRNAATQQLAADRNEDAVELYEQAAELVPPGMNALVLEGVARQRSGDPETARRRFLQAAERAPGAQDPRIALANLALIRGDREEAAAWYERALELDPINPLALVNWGDALSWLGEEEAAEEIYRRALGVNPRQPEPPLRLAALILDRGGDAAEAAGLLRSVRRHRPEHPELPGLEARLRGEPAPEPAGLIYAHRLLRQQRVLFNLQRPSEPRAGGRP